MREFFQLIVQTVLQQCIMVLSFENRKLLTNAFKPLRAVYEFRRGYFDVDVIWMNDIVWFLFLSSSSR